MHIVIMGCGRVGAAATVALAKRGHSVAIIDKRPEAFEKFPPGFSARTIVGPGFDRTVLEDAGIKEAGGFVAVSNGDNSNIVSARIAREHYHVPKVVARIYDPRRAEIYEKLSIPTIASVRWAASQIQFLLFHGMDEMHESLAGGALMHFALDAPAHLVGQRAGSLEVEGQIDVIGIERGGTGFIPTDASTFQQDDVVHFMVTKDSMEKLDALLQKQGEFG